MNKFCIGDIHGSYKGLIQCLERSSFNKEEDTLITLGDIADGWSQVPECIEELLSIKNLITIKGNHDEWTYEWLRDDSAPNIWTSQGGQATIDAYEKQPHLKEKHLYEFFSKQLPYYIDESNRAFVHAGYTSLDGLGNETIEDEYWWDRKLWGIALGAKNPFIRGDSELPKILRPHTEIFIGHTTTTRWGISTPINACNVWNIDTGGGWDGKITIMNIDSKEFFQSNTCSELYPDEKGR